MSRRRIAYVNFFIAALSGLLAAVGSPWAEPPEPKDGPLGMKFVPLPKATFYMGWNGDEGLRQEDGDQGGLRDRHPHGDAGPVAGSDGQESELVLPRRQGERQGQGHQG